MRRFFSVRHFGAAVAVLFVLGCERGSRPAQRTEAAWINFRAVGQEPGWILDIDKTSMRLLYAYGEKEIQLPVPTPSRNGSTTVYEAVTEVRLVRVVVRVAIEDRPCSDSMSGDSYPQTVTVTVDGETLRGCGREMKPPE